MVNGWLGTFLFSAGTAGLIFDLLVIPWTIGSWEKTELPLPAFVLALREYQVVIAAALVAGVIVGMLGLGVVRPRVFGLLVYFICLLACLFVAVSGLLSWWMMYAGLLTGLS